MYSLSPNEVLLMPVKRFWLFDKNVSRMEAAETLLDLDRTVAASSTEGYKDMHERLKQQLGVIALDAPKLDSAGLAGLASMNQ